MDMANSCSDIIRLARWHVSDRFRNQNIDNYDNVFYMIYLGMELSLILEIEISTMNTSTMWKMKTEKSSMLYVEKTENLEQR